LYKLADVCSCQPISYILYGRDCCCDPLLRFNQTLAILLLVADDTKLALPSLLAAKTFLSVTSKPTYAF